MRILALASIVLCWAWSAVAQSASAEAESWPPRLAIGGDVSLTFSTGDEYYFNYTDYQLDQTRLATGGIGGSFRIAQWLTAVGEVRFENAVHLWPSALYARIKPTPRWPLTVQVGRIPPTFGAFSQLRYGSDNPLISLPLAYQSLTILRDDAVPADADALLSVRGRGWYVPYDTYGAAPLFASGLPLVASTRWDTGVQGHVETNVLDVTVALTRGSLSRPQVRDNNDGKQVLGRVVWTPAPAVVLGLSLARGSYLARSAADTVPPESQDGPWTQSAIGGDLEISAGHWLARGEVIVNRWRVPVVGAPEIDSPLGATGVTVELRYKPRPAWYVAARGDHVTLSDIAGTLSDGRSMPWDAPVSRIEVGGGYLLSRDLRLKLAYQYNWRYGDTRVTHGLLATQLSWRF